MYYAALFADAKPGWLLAYPDRFDAQGTMGQIKAQFKDWAKEMARYGDTDDLLADVYAFSTRENLHLARRNLKAGLGLPDLAHFYRLTIGPRGGVKQEEV